MIKKVALVVCAWPPQGGGIGNNASYHLQNLIARGYQAKAFTPSYKNIKNSGEAAVSYLPVILPIGKAGFLLSLFWKLKEFDLIHLYYPFFGTDLIILLFKIFHPRIKLILHYQMDAVGQGLQKLMFKLHLKLFLGPLVSASDKIIVLSWDNAHNSYLKPYLIKYKNKFVAIANGIETALFRPQPKKMELLRKYNLSISHQVIIFVGGLDSQHFFKGVDILLKSFSEVAAKNQEARLMIIGEGNKKRNYQELTDKLEVQEKVIFTGWLANEQLADYYNLGTLFVLPSTQRTESFGIVIAEAQACGLPAIVSNWPGSRQTIAEGQTGLLVEPKNSRDLTQKINLLLNDENLRRSMKEAAIKRATEKYAWSEVIKKIDQLYKTL